VARLHYLRSLVNRGFPYSRLLLVTSGRDAVHSQRVMSTLERLGEVDGRPRRVPMNCPLCGARLTYLRTDDETHVLRHGEVILPPDGRMRSNDQEAARTPVDTSLR